MPAKKIQAAAENMRNMNADEWQVAQNRKAIFVEVSEKYCRSGANCCKALTNFRKIIIMNSGTVSVSLCRFASRETDAVLGKQQIPRYRIRAEVLRHGRGAFCRTYRFYSLSALRRLTVHWNEAKKSYFTRGEKRMQFKKNRAILSAVLASAMAASTLLSVTASAAGTRKKEEKFGDKTYAQRFMSLYDDVYTHGKENGYLSKDGVPYHSVEELICEAPDYGHETTSEAMSYIVWIAAMHSQAPWSTASR
jgi:hypothetical protein